MSDVLSKTEFNDVSSILMAGSFSECNLVQQAICKTFEKKQVHVYFPDEQYMAVRSGAILCDKIGQQMINYSVKEVNKIHDLHNTTKYVDNNLHLFQISNKID